MKKHTAIYMDAFGYGLQDRIPCEITGRPANDIHHIYARGMGGSKEADRLENLMALSRDTHLIFGDKKRWIGFLIDVHLNFLNTQIPYVEVNPHHEGFDYLLDMREEYRNQIIKIRKNENH